MTVYYPGYRYLFVDAEKDSFYPYYRKLTKNYIKAVLQDLHDTAHYAYVCLEHAPENRFAIIRYYDYVRRSIRPKSLMEEDHFTIPQFFQHFELLHESDEFRVLFYTEVFYYRQSFTPHILEIVYRHYLKSLCEKGLRENNPVCLTTKLIRKYRLNKADTKKVREYIKHANIDLLWDIQMEYNALANLDCVKKDLDEKE